MTITKLPSRSTRSAADYFRDPSAAHLLGRRFICASPGHDLYALLAWGKLQASDARELIEVLEHARTLGSKREQLVVLREVEGVSLGAMGMFLNYYSQRPSYLQTVRSEAVVRPGGIVGIMAEGFYPAVPMPFRHAVFQSGRAALKWLATPAPIDELVDWLAEAEACVRHHGAQASLGLGRLHEVIVELGARASIDEVARAMATSRRTLQRRLADAETSFRRERDHVLVGLAAERLSDVDRGLKEISAELGYASDARFSEQFRRVTGETPSQWRQRHRQLTARR